MASSGAITVSFKRVKRTISRRTFMKKMGLQFLVLLVSPDLEFMKANLTQPTCAGSAYGRGIYGRGIYAGGCSGNQNIFLPMIIKEGN